MKSLIFISSNIIYKKDIDKLGLKILSKKFKVILISFKKINLENTKINSKIKFINQSNVSSIKKIINDNNIYGLVDLMFPSIGGYLIKKYAINKNIKLIKLNNSIFPSKKRNLKEKLLLNFNIFNPNREKIIPKIFNHFYLFINSFIKYDYIFICRKVDENINRSKKTIFIKCHGFDYDKFLELKNKPSYSSKKIVYIDNDWLNHPDYKLHNASFKIDKINFKKKMNNFFAKVEKKFNSEIIIAANPKSNIKKIKSLFNNRKTYQNKTHQLINNCSCVIATKSTALSFAILFSKPIIFITFNDVLNNELGNGILSQSALLGKKVINIDKNLSINKNEYTFVNKKKYYLYKKNFIKYPGSKEIKSWQIFLNKIEKI